MANLLSNEEYIEQCYFFRTLRERMAANQSTQEILSRIHEEVLATTQLPLAIEFLATELKHSGLLSSGFAQLQHYFTPFQAFVIRQTEDEKQRIGLETALLVLEREAKYRAGEISPAGLFVYQFETMSRNRLGYQDGLIAMKGDPYFDGAWRDYFDTVRQQIGIVDFADLIYLRSSYHVVERQRTNAGYQPPLQPLFGEKEGKIARANSGRDPLFMFAALQRQLGYPVVPRPQLPDDTSSKIEGLKSKVRELDMRVRLVESELRGQIDLSEFTIKPEDLRHMDDED